MKKELIYELVNKGFDGKDSFASYLPEFVQELRNEHYHKMADDIVSIMTNRNKVSKCNTSKKTFNISLPLEITSNIEIIKNGYKNNLIKHVMLKGRPGTGKTSFVKIIANKMNLPFFEISLSSILDYKYGESIKHLHNIMKTYVENECIIFFDDADSLFRKRGSTNDVMEGDRILISMLKILDDNQKCLIFFATNIYSSLDAAIQRRMDLDINFDVYTQNDYFEILKKYIKEYSIELSSDDQEIVDLVIKKETSILSPSDIKNICKQIAIAQMTNNQIQYTIDKYIKNMQNRDFK